MRKNGGKEICNQRDWNRVNELQTKIHKGTQVFEDELENTSFSSPLFPEHVSHGNFRFLGAHVDKSA